MQAAFSSSVPTVASTSISRFLMSVSTKETAAFSSASVVGVFGFFGLGSLCAGAGAFSARGFAGRGSFLSGLSARGARSGRGSRSARGAGFASDFAAGAGAGFASAFASGFGISFGAGASPFASTKATTLASRAPMPKKPPFLPASATFHSMLSRSIPPSFAFSASSASLTVLPVA